MVFIGYEQNSKAYRTFDPSSRNLVVSRDVVFEEGIQWNWDSKNVENMHAHPQIFSV
jgi:hypothetical protein